jgi:exopolysaccharide biosynthesis protein
MTTITALTTKPTSKLLRITGAITDHIIVCLPGGKKVDVHVARFLKNAVKPRLIQFDRSTPLLRYCRENNIQNAINGGFTMHHTDKLLGEIWINGQMLPSVPFTAPWHQDRGSLYISPKGDVKIAPRYFFPKKPSGDLLQTAPLLVYRGSSMIVDGKDPEGISASSDQFDDDWTGTERYPRAVIGANEDFIFCVSVNGYWPDREQGKDTGMTLGELADLMIRLGATEALNLDGGSSATLVANGKMLNDPRAGITYNFTAYPEGRPIHNAIIFETA